MLVKYYYNIIVLYKILLILPIYLYIIVFWKVF